MARKPPSQTLHDDIGPLLSAAGLHLQLIATDFPQTAQRMDEVFRILDQAIDGVRVLSRELAPGRKPRVSGSPAAKTASNPLLPRQKRKTPPRHS